MSLFEVVIVCPAYPTKRLEEENIVLFTLLDNASSNSITPPSKFVDRGMNVEAACPLPIKALVTLSTALVTKLSFSIRSLEPVL